MLRRNLYLSSFLIAALLISIVSLAKGQSPRKDASSKIGPASTSAADLQNALPASDVVAFIDVKRLLTEAVPRALADNPAKLAAVNADIDQFKTRTGIDARSIERIAVGARISNPSANVTKIDNTVAIARGTFDENTLVAAGRFAAKYNYKEVKHNGKRIHLFNPNENIKLFGLLPSVRVNDLALCVLDANTLAVGDLAGVRGAIDASEGRNRIGPELVSLAQRNPNAIVGFGGNLPPALMQNLDLGTEQIAKSVASIQQFYGSLGTTTDGFDMLTVLRTATASDATNLSATLTSLKAMAPLLIAQLPQAEGKLAQNALNSLKISTQGNEVQLSLLLPQTDIAVMMKIF